MSEGLDGIENHCCSLHSLLQGVTTYTCFLHSVWFQSENCAANRYYLLQSWLRGSMGNMCQDGPEASEAKRERNVFHSCFPQVSVLSLSAPTAQSLSDLLGCDTSGLLTDTVIEGQVINCVRLLLQHVCLALMGGRLNRLWITASTLKESSLSNQRLQITNNSASV